MTDDPIDTGFDAVLAGEAWTPPAEVEIRELPPGYDPVHVCVNARGGKTCDICFKEITAAVKPEDGLTEAGRQAAKALVHLPQLTWPELAKLAREMAMDIKERTTILKEFGLSDTQYDFLETHNTFYREVYQHACKEWHAPMSTQDRIKLEAAAILEDSLLGLGARMQNKGEGLPGVVEAFKFVGKIAGVGERETGPTAPGERFTINIDLGGDKSIAISTAAPKALPAAEPFAGSLSSDGEVS